MAKRHGHYRARGTGRSKTSGSNYKKAKNNRKQNRSGSSRGGHNANFLPVGGGDLSNTDMMDDYYFGHNHAQNSMHMGGFRPGKEGFAQEEKEARTLPLRKRPVEFTKAEQVYDPAHDFILNLRKKEQERQQLASNNSYEDTETERVAVDAASDEPVEEPVEVDVASDDSSVSDSESEELKTESFTEPSKDISDERLFFVDETPLPRANVKTVHVDAPTKNVSEIGASATEFDPVLVVGKTELNLLQDKDGSASVSMPQGYKSHPFKPSSRDQLDRDSSWDEIGDYDDYDELDSIDYDEYDEAYDSDSEGDVSSEKEAPNADTVVSGSSILSSTIQSLSLNEDKEPEVKSGENEPEFGFLDEDFALNVSELEISNIRIGSQDNSYYMSSYRYFGDYDKRWVDQDDLEEFVAELGLPDHRIRAYLRYVMDALVPKNDDDDARETRIAKEAALLDDSDSENTDEESEVAYPISEDDDEDLGEGLEDLVAYSLKYEAVRNKLYDTKSLQTSGKGSKKKLLLNEQLDIDSDLKSQLEDKFATRVNDKRIKRQTKEDYVSASNSASDDLFLKYPYGFHVENIKDEFDIFLASNRPTLSFPPFDPHGNKTVISFAGAYSMKTRKMGKSGKSHVLVEKVKKTKWSLPNYNYVSQLLRRRRVFMRIDVRRPREEHHFTERINVGKVKFQTKEGEIVGEDAPEIGTDNIGRQMLEKLGWSRGQGLGADGNQGISEPIFAKVKKSKSGLRHG
ncbi:Sqs1p LALA0_S07e04720g [Lachancea lanzarotensis]|uniref:Protein SQS1 n=1 Tax=Lachancea lanzarotensis TaxID=1245769 RepID=A0A0C7N9G7_9SACH|nr:uncharacterized protein LALA0_S07e04720g [Lachancea lanzarotensis]CEP63200.1 LALA0S07e04720g1_1 [Lachancea lanzarotensis]